MNTNFIQLTIELIIGFFALLLITKVLGKTQITQLTPFDFISALVLGELVGNAIYDKEIGAHFVLYAVALWGLLIYLIEMLTQKIKKTRSFLEGNPAIIVQNGKIDYQQLKKNRLDINQLQSLLRSKNVFSIREVSYAILEPNGSISILKKSNYDTPTKQDINMSPKSVYLPTTVISDGKIVFDNLIEAGYSEEWLHNELNKQGIVNVKRVFYAEWLEGDSLYINTYH
ncbi:MULTISPECIES: YetF domain-containing protein [Bacillaceae]|uniref:DUF421 domain-containing protein n=1 Tax=Evansella alkalicola TaxID=745819 RepID=A0ABS6K1G8_9BACI|nr:DUF421 domain-containing protein [Litchfieldia alkalitelluris]MBU9723282.1 DUF421 domain-containing protein [Bacillus alkalicola]